MTRRLTAVLALTAAGALAVVGAPPATAAVPAAGAGHPAAVSARSHPTPPPAFRRALLAAAGRAKLSLGRPVPTAAGLRPIGGGISTDLPTRLAVAEYNVTVPYTVIVPTSKVKNPAVAIGLVVAAARTSALESEIFVIGTPGQTTFRGIITIPISAITLLGQGGWVVAYGASSGNPTGSTTLLVTVKNNSLLGEAVTRRGSTVRVVGAAKVFADGGYRARPGLRVGVDRYAGHGKYVRLTTVTTDRLGHLNVNVRIPWTVGIRLTDADTSTVFGAITPLKTI